MEFLNSLKKRSKHYSSPFDHWELNEPLTKEALKEICKTEITDLTEANINYDGTRAIDGGGGEFRKGISTGGKAIKFRCFIEKDNSKDFPHLTNLIEELRSKNTYNYISELIKKDLSNSYVRVEIICDRQGFWLKPHCDIEEKLISSLIFANPFNESENLGTDLYDEKLNNDSEFSNFGEIVGMPTTQIYSPEGELLQTFMGEITIEDLNKFISPLS